MTSLAAGGPVPTQSWMLMGSQDLACCCSGFIQLMEEADWHLHPHHPSLADGLTECPEPALWWEEGKKHERALLALQWKY